MTEESKKNILCVLKGLLPSVDPAHALTKIISIVESDQKKVKPLSPYTRPHYKPGRGWMVYGKLSDVFYSHRS